MLRLWILLPLLLALGCVSDPQLVVDLATSDTATSFDLSTPADADVAPDLGVADLSSTDLTPLPPDLTPVTPAWVASSTGLDGANVQYVVVDTDVIYVANLFDVYVSTNNGVSFDRIPVDWIYVAEGISSLAARGGHLYIGLTSGRLLEYVAPNLIEITGPTFAGEKPSLTKSVAQLEPDRSSNGERVFVSDGDNVFLYDGMASTPWTMLSTLEYNFPAAENLFFMRSNVDGSLLYLTSSEGLLTWDGATWTTNTDVGLLAHEIDVRGSGPAMRAVVLIYPSSGENQPTYFNGSTWGPVASVADTRLDHVAIGSDGSLVLAAFDGLWQLATPTSAWAHRLNLPGSRFGWLTTDESRATIYAGGLRGLYRMNAASSTTGSFLNHGLHGVNVVQITPSPRDEDVIYAATESGLYRSNNSGGDWTELTALGPRRDISRVIAIDADGDDRLYVIAAGELFRSNDAGITFTDLGIAAHAVAAHGQHPDHVFICAGTRAVPTSVRISQNVGASFSPMGSGPSTCDAMLATSDGALTVTSGVTWWLSANPTMSPLVMRGSFATAARSIAKLIEVLNGDSVLGLTAEPGATARDLFLLPYVGAVMAIAKPSLGPSLRDLAMSPSEPNRLWLATREGMFVGTLGAGTYNAANVGLPGGEVTAVGRSPTLSMRGWVGIEERGMFRSE